MTTKLDGHLKREIEIDGAAWTLTLTQEGFVLVPKGRRRGYEMHWSDFVSGDLALATSLNASLAQALPRRKTPDGSADADPDAARHAPEPPDRRPGERKLKSVK